MQDEFRIGLNLVNFDCCLLEFNHFAVACIGAVLKIIYTNWFSCEFINLIACASVWNQILSNCRLNLVKNLIICNLNLAKFKFPCPSLIVLLSLAKAVPKNFLWVLNFVFICLYECFSPNLLNSWLNLAKRYRFNNTFYKSFDYFWFYLISKFGKKFTSLWLKFSKF